MSLRGLLSGGGGGWGGVGVGVGVGVRGLISDRKKPFWNELIKNKIKLRFPYLVHRGQASNL